MTNWLSFDAFREILSRITYKKVEFVCMPSRDGHLFYLCADLPDNETGEMSHQVGRKWFVPADSTVSDIVRTAFLTVQTWEEHETREQFLYKGVAIFTPHFDVTDLHQLVHQE